MAMTTQERYDDISKISGLSENIVRRVLNAEKTSIEKSLRRGERATIIGRCTVRPEIRKKLEVGGTFKDYIKLIATIAPSLESNVNDESLLKESDNESESVPSVIDYSNGVRIRQIRSLV